MAFPTPSDLLWVTGFSPHGRWLVPLLKEAVRKEWPAALRLAESQLGDPSVARELLEEALQEAHEILIEKQNPDLNDVRKELMRSYRNGIRRIRRKSQRIRLKGSAADLDLLPATTRPFEAHVEAKVDLHSLLSDTPKDVQKALLMRYGDCSTWEEIARTMSMTQDGIRMKCKRELNRLAAYVGLKPPIDPK